MFTISTEQKITSLRTAIFVVQYFGIIIALGGIGLHCMKCGSEIEDGQVFCERCLSDMKRCPVKPGTRIQLPNRPAPEAAKKPAPKKRTPTAEEKLTRLRQVVKWLAIALVTSLLLLGFTISLLLEESGMERPQENIGQNYNTIGEHSNTD